MSRLSRLVGRGLGLGLLLSLVPLGAAGAQDLIPISAERELAPGEYFWDSAAAAAEGPVEIVVSLPLQRAFVYRDGALIGESTVSSGKEGHESPIGRFEILQKREVHHSNRYDDAPMPFMQRLTWQGVALHAGTVPGYPASHGCIRLPAGFARRLFGITGLGDVVMVVDAPVSAETALEEARASA